MSLYTLPSQNLQAEKEPGWDRPTRERRLQYLTNNTRLLIPGWIQIPHLVSHVLGLITRRIRADWQAK